MSARGKRTQGMPEKNAEGRSGGFSADERAAMKARAAELRAEGKKGVKKADGLQAVLDKIAEMAPDDRALAERVHMTITTVASEWSPRTWYGMPAYSNADGKIVVAFKNSGKFDSATRHWSSRTPRTSTTARCGRCRSRLRTGARRWRRRSPPWSSPLPLDHGLLRPIRRSLRRGRPLGQLQPPSRAPPRARHRLPADHHRLGDDEPRHLRARRGRGHAPPFGAADRDRHQRRVDLHGRRRDSCRARGRLRRDPSTCAPWRP